MKYLRYILLSGLLAAPWCLAGPAEGLRKPVFIADLPTGPELQREVVANLPAEPLVVRGRLQTLNAGGEVDREWLAEMRLHWSSNGASRAAYVISDAFGRALAELDLVRATNGAVTRSFFTGPDRQPAAFAGGGTPIEGTDFVWGDLSLDFLWWPGGRTVAVDGFKGRKCVVVELPAPAESGGGAAWVRLWIEPKFHALLQAELCDAQKQPVRVLRVKSFRKIDGVWMIQDLEAQRLPAHTRTVLAVETVNGRKPAAGPAAPAE